jgi:hypothetical protein
MKKTHIKPNGKPFGIFTISINDGFVEYSYDAKVNGSESIESLLKKMAKGAKIKPMEGVLRTSYTP